MPIKQLACVLYFEHTSCYNKNFELLFMAYVVCEVCRYCSKEQPNLNLFCINCNKREWSIDEFTHLKHH